jgi:hypothetical protein
MTRVQFFEGQLLTASDLEAEQTYQMEKRRLHNRMLHGVGVVDGLAVSVEDLPSAAAIVSPGLALDCYGNEIIVEAPIRVDLGICPRDTCFVTIQYTEFVTDPVLTTDGDVAFSRVTEGFTVAIMTEDPCESAKTQRLGLARLIRGNGHWIVDETYGRRIL